MDKTKVKAILDWPYPTSIKQLRGFLGLTGYYRRFIKGYSTIALPLTSLLKKDGFHWTEQAAESFRALQHAITHAPVLHLPNFSEKFILETDASGTGIGAVLSQANHPIAFFSKKLSLRMQKQSAYVRELYAISEAISKFRHYLLGHEFVIRTDQKSLRSLTTQAIQTPEQQVWLHKFLGYNFTIEYKPGKDNVAADALSRSIFLSLSTTTSNLIQLIDQAISQDPTLSKVKADCYHGVQSNKNFLVKHGMLFWNSRLLVPPLPELINKILTEFHSSPLGGHSGIKRTKARIAAQFYWPSMSKDISSFIRECLICQQAKHDHSLPAGLLQPLPIPLQIWEDVAMDFITGLPPSNGYSVILVVVDRLSKYGHFAPLRSDFSSLKVAETFLANIVKLHGFPKSIVSDRDKVFTSKFWQHLFKLSGTTLAMSSAYHPQTDGQSEAVNKCLEQYLRCFTANQPRVWSKLLPWAEYWYNTSFHSSLGMTPFKIVYGRDPPTLIKYEHAVGDPPALKELLQERDDVLSQLKINLLKALQHRILLQNGQHIPQVLVQ